MDQPAKQWPGLCVRSMTARLALAIVPTDWMSSFPNDDVEQQRLDIIHTYDGRRMKYRVTSNELILE